MAGSKRFSGDNYFNACLAVVRGPRVSIPVGWGGVSAGNSLSIAQCYILAIWLCPLSPPTLQMAAHPCVIKSLQVADLGDVEIP